MTCVLQLLPEYSNCARRVSGPRKWEVWSVYLSIWQVLSSMVSGKKLPLTIELNT